MKLVTCNRGCGTEDLHWKYPKGKYKLFDKNHLIHVCEDGIIKPKVYRQKATESIIAEVGAFNATEIPLPEENGNNSKAKVKKPKESNGLLLQSNGESYKYDPKKAFSITTNASGIAITGDDVHTAVYLPHVAIKDLIKALIEFI